MKRILSVGLFIAAVLLACGSRSVQAAEGPPPEKAAIRSLIDRLGADDWRQRRDAEEALRNMGDVTIPLLDYAAKEHGDVEVRLRARQIIAVLKAEPDFKNVLDLLDKTKIREALEPLDRLAYLAIGRYAERARFIKTEIMRIIDTFDGYDRGSTVFWNWYMHYPGADRNKRVFELGLSYNNLYLFVLAEGGRHSKACLDKAEFFYRTILDEETARKNRRVASCLAALLSAAGRFETGLKVLDRIRHLPPSTYLDHFDMASFWAYGGKVPKALDALRKGLVAAVESGYLSDAKAWARSSNDFESLHDLPEFKKLVGS